MRAKNVTGSYPHIEHAKRFPTLENVLLVRKRQRSLLPFHILRRRRNPLHQNLMPPCLSLISSFCICCIYLLHLIDDLLFATKEEPNPSSLLLIRGCLPIPVRPIYNKIKFRPSKPAKCLLTTAADPPTCHRSSLILLLKPVSNNPIVPNLATINHLSAAQANTTLQRTALALMQVMMNTVYTQPPLVS